MTKYFGRGYMKKRGVCRIVACRRLGDTTASRSRKRRRKRKKRGKKRRSTEAMKEQMERKKAPGMM
jgi:predicted GIY-YIG superfamily endonuclease